MLRRRKSGLMNVAGDVTALHQTSEPLPKLNRVLVQQVLPRRPQIYNLVSPEQVSFVGRSTGLSSIPKSSRVEKSTNLNSKI